MLETSSVFTASGAVCIHNNCSGISETWPVVFSSVEARPMRSLKLDSKIKDYVELTSRGRVYTDSIR